MRSVATSLDEQALTALLRELGEGARPYRFGVAPNPCVGAAVLAGTREAGRGFHQVFGEEHAEIAALAAAKRSAIPASEWTTLVVTLEPCSTSAKTPPCIDAIIASGIKTVVVGALDPDLRHRGRGLEALKAAGVEILLMEGIAALDWVSPHFLGWCSHERLRRPRPWTIAKWAQTLSGHLSPPLPRNLDSVPDPRISGPEAHAEVQHLRSRVDAVVTGIGTVLADDPLLTVRPPGVTREAPMRVVLDSYLRTRPTGRMFTHEHGPQDAAGQVHVLSFAGADGGRARALQAAGAEVHGLHGSARDSLDLRGVQGWLWDQGARRVLLEAGPTLLQAMLESGFVDQVRIYTSDMRGGEGNSLAGWLAHAKLLERADSNAGDDAVIDAFL